MTADAETPEARMLVVDDSRLIRRMVADYFGGHGFVVEEAESGEQALERLDALRPDVIVADVLMPGMDGWALCEAVRRRPEGADVPFVFLTVESELPARLKGLRLGADDYMTKPFAVEELHERVLRLLERARARAGRAGAADADALLTGSVEHLSIADLLQILSLNGKNARVAVRSGERQGEIVFADGEILHAECPPAGGRKALYRMLAWDAARFRVLPLAEGEARPEGNLGGRVADLLMDGMVALDEWNRWRDRLPLAETRLELVAGARSKLDREQLTPAEYEILRHGRERGSVGEILEQSSLADGELAHALCDLLERGIVRRAGD